MTKYPMTKEARKPNDETLDPTQRLTHKPGYLRHSGFVIPSSLGISSFVILSHSLVSA